MNDESKNLVRLLLTDPDPDVRRRSAEDLSDCHDPNVLAVLAIALQDENKGVEDAVARSLLNIGGVNVARAIVYHVEDDDIASRNLAAKLLIKLGENSVHALVPYLRSDNKDVRKLAVDILGEIRSSEPMYYLLPLLNDADPNVLVSALEALGNIGNNVAVKPICQAFEQHPFARIMAIEALGKIGGDSVRCILENKMKEAFTSDLKDEVYLFALLDAIGTVGNNTTLEILHANYGHLRGHLRDVLLHEMIHIIERCNIDFQFEPIVKDDMLRALASDNQHIQLSAAKGLVQFKDPEVTRALLLALGISEEMDFVVIAQMSARPKAFEITVECLEEGVTRGKIQMIMLLGKLATEFIHSYGGYAEYPLDETLLMRTVAVTREAWQDASEEDREIVADTLFRLDCDSAADFINEALVDLDPWSRVHIIDQLGTMPTRRVLECIARFVNDENDMVQEAAISALRAAGVTAEMERPDDGGEQFDEGVENRA